MESGRGGFMRREARQPGGGSSGSSGSSSSGFSFGASAPSSDAKRRYVETPEFRRRRGLQPAGADATRRSQSSSASSSSASASAAAPQSGQSRWVWSEAGFGLVVHDTLAVREAQAMDQRAKQIAASLSPSPVGSARSLVKAGGEAAPSLAAPQPSVPAPIDPAAGADASGVPAAPPLQASSAPSPSASPSTSRMHFLSLLASAESRGKGAGQEAKDKGFKFGSSESAPDAKEGSGPTLALPVLPPVSLAGVAPSCVEDHVAVHLLPHYSRASPSTATTTTTPASTSAGASDVGAAAASSSSSSSSSGDASASASSASPSPSATPSLFVANPPTVAYCPSRSVHESIRVRVHTFMDLASVTPKKKDEGRPGGLKDALSAEIRARKERASKGDSGSSSSGGASEANAIVAAAIADREEREKSIMAAFGGGASSAITTGSSSAPGSTKPSGPPPQSCTFDISCSESIRGLIQRVVDFYASYGATEMDPESIRLVNNGVEFTKHWGTEVSSPVVTGVVAAPAAAAASSKSVSAVQSPAQALLSSAADERAPPMERLSRLATYCNTYGASASTIAQVQALVTFAKKGGGQKLEPRHMTEVVALLQAEAPGNSSINGAQVANSKQGPSQADKDRFFRAHTMLAECGLKPDRSAAVAPVEQSEGGADASAAASLSASIPAASSASASSSSPQPPLFHVLLIYDELSRFVLDATNLPSELTLTSDLLGCSMTQADNKWQTIRASTPFTSGRHMWKVRMERCQGGNAFLGVCTTQMKLGNYIGHDTNSWGYYGCGNTYRSGSSSSYGQSYRTGDVITLQLDMDARTLSYEKNGQPLGLAFTDLPEQVYPAFSLYTKGDHFQLTEFGTF